GRVPALRRGCEDESGTDAIRSHLLGRIFCQRVPITVAKVHEQLNVSAFQFLFNVVDDFEVEVVERAITVDVEVMLSYFHQSLAWDTAPTRYNLKKWNDLLVAFRATEGKNEEGIIITGVWG